MLTFTLTLLPVRGKSHYVLLGYSNKFNYVVVKYLMKKLVKKIASGNCLVISNFSLTRNYCRCKPVLHQDQLCVLDITCWTPCHCSGRHMACKYRLSRYTLLLFCAYIQVEARCHVHIPMQSGQRVSFLFTVSNREESVVTLLLLPTESLKPVPSWGRYENAKLAPTSIRANDSATTLLWHLSVAR